MTVVYTAVLLVALCGFASLAVDLGHVQVVKTELLHAADAAARAAAVSFVTSGVTAAQDSAVTWAAANKADGTPVAISSASDVEFGTWSASTKTFTVLSGSARSSASAVRVWCRRTTAGGNPVRLTFGPLVGMASVDAKASAIATASVNGGGVVGLDSVTLSGAAYVDGYDSSAGAYGAGTADANGRVASNGDVTLSNSTYVRGDAYPGSAGGSVTLSGTSYVTGSKTQRLPAPLSYPAPSLPAAGSYTEGGGPLTITGIGQVTLAAGAYHYSSLTMGNSAVLTTTGAVTIYIDGAVNIGGASVVSVYQSRPKNLRIVVLGSGGVSISNGSNVVADVYAPLSAVSVANAGGLSGAAVGKTLYLGNSGGIHYDESLGYGAAGAVVVTTLK